MDLFVTGQGEQYLESARGAVRSVPASEALSMLGWVDLLAHLDDVENRRAVFALFRAQGHELMSSGALGMLMAQPYMTSAHVGGKAVVASVPRESPQLGSTFVVSGLPDGGCLLIDKPGRGTWLIERDDAVFESIDIAGRLDLYRVQINLTGVQPTIPEQEASAYRHRSTFFGRLALAFEMLGAAEAMLALTIYHATNREQFGRPIASFQAVRHLLARARLDCTAIQATAEQALELDRRLPAGYDAVVKAIAGRNGRRASQRTLQVLGAIGFTREHDHHHFYSRILCLDSLLGSSTALAHHVVSNWRQSDLPLPLIGLHEIIQSS